jgi:thiol-disulfide isomerase/thioredoxin
MNDADARSSVATGGAARAEGGRTFTWFLMIAVIGLGVLVGLLVRSNHRLKEQVNLAEQALARERTRDSVATGDELSAIVTQNADGAQEEKTFRAGKATVVFLIAGKCPYCEETIPVWQEVIRATRAIEAGKVELLTIQTDAKSGAELRVIGGGVEPRLVAKQAGTWLLRVPISPGAMLVDGNGVVRRVWFGMPSEKDREELVQALLGVMPGR